MSYRLLIVEDTPALLQAISVFFREKGAGLWEIVASSNGNDALDNLLKTLIRSKSPLSRGVRLGKTVEPDLVLP
jgi:CheY-like chemotaxis protein